MYIHIIYFAGKFYRLLITSSRDACTNERSVICHLSALRYLPRCKTETSVVFVVNRGSPHFSHVFIGAGVSCRFTSLDVRRLADHIGRVPGR